MDGKDPISTAAQSKKAKLDNDGTTQNKSMIWEYEGDKSKWTKYSDDQLRSISDAFKDGKTEVSINDGKADVTVIFSRMVQRNQKSSWEKRIRCLGTDSCTDPDECKCY